MNKRIILIAAAVLLILLPVAASATPKAVPAAPVYEFDPVPEGQVLSHDFIIRNEGDTELEITGVIPP